jgi:hypothetical protein
VPVAASENVSVPLADVSPNAFAWMLMKRSASLLFEYDERPASVTNTSVSRVISAVHLPPPASSALSASRSALKRLLTSRTTFFSCIPVPTPPGSVPPWPGSMTTFTCASATAGAKARPSTTALKAARRMARIT